MLGAPRTAPGVLLCSEPGKRAPFCMQSKPSLRSKLNPKASEFKLNPGASEFKPKAPSAAPKPPPAGPGAPGTPTASPASMHSGHGSAGDTSVSFVFRRVGDPLARLLLPCATAVTPPSLPLYSCPVRPHGLARPSPALPSAPCFPL